MSLVIFLSTLTSLLAIVYLADNPYFQESKKRNPRIVGGTQVESRKLYPFQVSVRYRTQHVCGGTLIHPRFILTAAHCAINREKLLDVEEFSIVVGGLSVYKRNNSTIYRNIWRRHQHPRYFSTLIKNDIALLELLEPLEENTFVKPISFSESFPTPGTICKVAGWGLTNIEKTDLITSPNLMEIDVLVLSPDECSTLFSWLSYDNSKICGYSAKGCPNLGDSGGPLICNGQIFGVISFGKMYHCVRSANCFTSTQYHYKWIKYIISKSEYSRRYGDIFTFDARDIFNFVLESIMHNLMHMKKRNVNE